MNADPAALGASSFDAVVCRPCRAEFPVETLRNAKRCPKCGGPVLNKQQMGDYRAATEEALVRHRKATGG